MDMEAKNHTDPGNIRLTVISKLTAEGADKTIASIVNSIDQRIRKSGDGVQIFEEGVVAKLTDIRSSKMGKGNLDSCCYAMHFLDSKTAGCARMHFHPGERHLIVIIPAGATFNVNSLSPIEIADPTETKAIQTRIAPDPVLETMRHDVQVSGPAQIIVQIPSNVSHQFVSTGGRAGANSFHPDEAEEKRIVGAGIASGTMQGHTIPFVSFCAMEAPDHGNKDTHSKERAIASLLDFNRQAQSQNLLGPHDVAKKLMEEHSIRITPHQAYGEMAKLFETRQKGVVSKSSLVDMTGKTRSSALLVNAETVPLIAEQLKSRSASRL